MAAVKMATLLEYVLCRLSGWALATLLLGGIRQGDNDLVFAKNTIDIFNTHILISQIKEGRMPSCWNLDLNCPSRQKKLSYVKAWTRYMSQCSECDWGVHV